MNEHLKRLRRAIDFIEADLRRPLDIVDIAKVAGFSPWHFQRLFRAVTGDSVYGYVSARRMTLAAESLLKSEIALIDLALDLQFESQEAFTRAFKAYHGLPPGAYRRRRGLGATSFRKPRASGEYLTHIYQEVKMKPEIREWETRELVGMSARFAAVMAEIPNNHEVIPALWKRFHRRLAEVPARFGVETFGVIESDPLEGKAPRGERLHEAYVYHSCVRVGEPVNPPEGMQAVSVPGGKYACFSHQGPIAKIDHTIGYILGSWLPASGLTLDERPTLEVFPAGYDPKSESARMEFCVPLRKT